MQRDPRLCCHNPRRLSMKGLRRVRWGWVMRSVRRPRSGHSWTTRPCCRRDQPYMINQVGLFERVYTLLHNQMPCKGVSLAVLEVVLLSPSLGGAKQVTSQTDFYNFLQVITIKGTQLPESGKCFRQRTGNSADHEREQPPGVIIGSMPCTACQSCQSLSLSELVGILGRAHITCDDTSHTNASPQSGRTHSRGTDTLITQCRCNRANWHRES